MVESAQMEIDCNDDEGYRRQETADITHISENSETLSENFNSEIDLWARRALAANGFGDY